ncbi:MAG: AraC family transcriptional regulator [bacterium]|nr:AraC family transcriptional regulator [bacterium]
MIPSDGFSAAFTVPNFHQKLDGSRPIQVYTYAFDPLDEAAEPVAAPGPICGTLLGFPGVNALPPHDHDHHEISIVTGGTAIHRTADKVTRLSRGSALAIAPGEVHAFEEMDAMSMVNCTYLTEWLFYDLRELLLVDGLAALFFPRAICSTGHRLLLPEWRIDDRDIEPCLRELNDIAEERARPEPSPMFMRRVLEKLMLMLQRTYVASGADTPMPFQPEVRTAIERIEEHILQGDAFDAPSLAGEMGMSRDHFARQFKQATGWSPTDYFQNRRVQHASCLLLNSRQSATEVAYALGYFDASHFSRLFKRYRGISPREYRRRYAAAG